jgi:hypothetical protein
MVTQSELYDSHLRWDYRLLTFLVDGTGRLREGYKGTELYRLSVVRKAYILSFYPCHCNCFGVVLIVWCSVHVCVVWCGVQESGGDFTVCSGLKHLLGEVKELPSRIIFMQNRPFVTVELAISGSTSIDEGEETAAPASIGGEGSGETISPSLLAVAALQVSQIGEWPLPEGEHNTRHCQMINVVVLLFVLTLDLIRSTSDMCWLGGLW